jgi:hypothetical protein
MPFSPVKRLVPVYPEDHTKKLDQTYHILIKYAHQIHMTGIEKQCNLQRVEGDIEML